MSEESADTLELGETLRGLCEGQVMFGRYRLRRVIGRGGMGVVWQAQDGGLGRDVALKFLPESVAHDRTAVDDLKRETRRALALTHSHIVRIHDFLCDGLVAAIVMELIDGDTLARRRLGGAEKVMPVAELRPIVSQLCEALDYAHVQGRVVHRDLKPANLMLNRAGELKVTDFGIAATIADATTRVSRVVGLSGTPVYMSPQQLMGDTPAVTDDLYSVGATLYELLTGKPPFYSGDIAAQVQGKVPLRVSARRAELGIRGEGGSEAIPATWEEAIAACLAKDPSHRPQSARELAARMQLVGEGRRPGDGAAGVADTRPAPGRGRVVSVSGGAEEPAVSFGFGERGRRTLVTAAVALALLGAAGYVGFHASGVRRPSEGEAAARSADGASRMPRPGVNWEIPDMGLEFVPVPGSGVLCSIWETRVQDFAAFVAATGHDATRGMVSFRLGSYGMNGDTWKAPGYRQGPKHPVVGVNDEDAQAFCAWLTKRERAAGRLTKRQEYRLPTDKEWDAAVGAEEFPWGKQWPPSAGAGNLCDESAAHGELTRFSGLRGYDDGFNATAPVGSFRPNALGIYDLAGNVQERVGGRLGGLRGSSFGDAQREDLTSFARANDKDRTLAVGFRVVCDLGEAAPGAQRVGGPTGAGDGRR